MANTAGLPLAQEKGHQISYNRRNDSSVELEVFDAAEYFSDANGIYGASFTLQQKIMRSGGRISLDIPMMSDKSSSVPSPSRYQKFKEDKNKYKQPSTPGGKLVSFLYSLFNQISSKKKSSYTKSMKGDQDHDHFRNLTKISSSTSNSSKSKSSLSTSEFKTLPNAHTSTENSSKNIQSNSNHNPNVMMISTNLSKMDSINIHVNPSCSSHKKIYMSEKIEKSWLHGEKFKFMTSNEFLSEKCSNFVYRVLGDKTDHSEDSTNFRNFINDEDDGADSDSSSDLFEAFQVSR